MKLHELFSAIGEPTRIGILRSLADGKKSVTDIAKILNCEIVNVSHHLGVMKNARIVSVDRAGRFMMYSLASELFTTDENNVIMSVPGARLELSRKAA